MISQQLVEQFSYNLYVEKQTNTQKLFILGKGEQLS